MKWMFTFVAVVLTACSKSATSPSDPEAPLVGWRSAGLVSPSGGEGTDRWEWMSSSGMDIFVLNGKGEIYYGVQGSQSWLKLSIPDQESASCIKAYPEHLLIGTAKTGRILRYSNKLMTWDSLPTAAKLPADVTMMGWFDGKLVFFASKQDSGNRIRLLDTSSLKVSNWGAGYPRYYAMALAFQVFNDELYLATYSDGLWKRGLHDSVWTETTRPLDTVTLNLLKMPRGLAVHHDSLWMGQLAASIYRTRDGIAWTEIDNCPISSPCFDAPYSAFALLSYRDRLFAAGQGTASPVEWDPDSSKWVSILNETWRRTVNGKSECGGSSTWDLAAIGDTLYACGNARIMKMPLSDLPKRGR